MASKRMFSESIVKSDAFTSMPLSTQALYMHINIEADDDGFCNRAKLIQRSIGASDDDLTLLIAKKFLLAFEDGVVLVKHWYVNNLIRSDRYHPTTYQNHLKEIIKDSNNIYHWKTDGIPNGYQMDTNGIPMVYRDKNSIDKFSIEKVSLDKNREEVSFLTDEQFTELIQKYTYGKVIIRAKNLKVKTYDNLIQSLEER